MAVPASASCLSTADRAQPVLDPHELLARASRPGAAGLCFFNLSPILVIGGHDSALFQEPLQPVRAGPIAGAFCRHRGEHLVGDLVPVRPVRTDGPGGAPPGPADRVQAIADPAAGVDE